MNRCSYSACILLNGTESQCVSNSVNLIGTILNYCPYNRDKKAILICTKSSWYESLDLMDRKLGRCFQFDNYSCSCTNKDNLDMGFDKCVNNLLEQSFGPVIRETFDNNGLLNSLWNSQSQKSDLGPGQPNFVKTENLFSQEELLRIKPEDYVNSLDFDNTPDLYSESMNRLLIRFVEEVPVRRFEDGKIVEYPPEMSYSSFWNYLQAANEISAHGDSIECVVVAGLSEINMINFSHNYPVVKKLGTKKTHAFTSLGSSGDERIYNPKNISMYSISLALTLNSVNSRIKNLKEINKCASGSFPKFFLVDTLPTDKEDAKKFTRFMCERFSYTFRVF